MIDTLAPRMYTIADRRYETPDTVTFELVTAEGRRMAFLPGQFTMLSVLGVGECAISISGDPARTDRIEQTVRAVGSVTDRLHRLDRGDSVGLRGPYGTGWPAADAGDDLLIIAGGLGLAPVRPAVLGALAARDAHRRLSLLVGARTPQDLPFRDELGEWAARSDIRVGVTVDAPDATWRGHVGVVTRLLDRVEIDPARTTALVCGPEVMMRHTVRALTHRGLDPDRVHVSLERNMRCGVGTCGHCQLGPIFVCRDGPVLTATVAAPFLEVREL